MKNILVMLLLAAAAIAIPSATWAATGYSYLGAWQPPTIYQSNWWYSQTAAFSGPSNATFTTIQWQLEWNVSGKYGIPPGMEMEICDAANHCVLITSPTSDGNTSYFQGESATQTFTFWFKIPTAQTIEYNPPYVGYSANSWLMENYQY